MIDYLVVGLGLAGVAFCEQLEENGKSFQVISDASQTSSSVAGGLYNPVILKRFTLAWKANEQIEMATSFYRNLEKKLNITLDYKLGIARRFNSVEEQNLWYTAMDKPQLADFMLPEIERNTNANIDAPFGLGTVLKTGRIDTGKMLVSYAEYVKNQEKLIQGTFDYKDLEIQKDFISYKSIVAKRIVFAEGFGLKGNPFFNYLPLNGNKGEYLTIEAPDLNEKKAIKSGIFCIPLGNHTYKIGASYSREDVTNEPTVETKEALLQKMEAFVKCDYRVIDQVAGVRPTVVDRRPLVGAHPTKENIYVLNGLGSRGVLIAPFVAPQLYRFIENQTVLDAEIDCARFKKRWVKK